jgi:aryl-alcohol dehydrogenase
VTAGYRAMTALVARAKGEPFTIQSARVRERRTGEVLVRVVATGLCHTDLSVRDQLAFPIPMPIVLGHEGAGVVEAVGANVTGLVPGDHVVLTFGTCGKCGRCVAGDGAYCDHFVELNFAGADVEGKTAILDEEGGPLHDHFFAQSSFASYAIARENNAIKVPRDAPLELLGPLGCGIQTGAGATINTLRVTPGSSFATFGAGAVGLSALMAARASGATTIIAVDIVPSRLELARELGATHAVNSREVNMVDAISEITGGGLDFAVESTGNARLLTDAIEALGTLGTIAVAGAPPAGMKAEFDINALLLRGRSIRGTVEGDATPQIFIPQLVRLYQQGRFPFDKLVQFYPCEQVNQAAEDARRGSTLKPILRFGDV